MPKHMLTLTRSNLLLAAAVVTLCNAAEPFSPESDLDFYLQMHKQPAGPMIAVPPMDIPNNSFKPIMLSDLPPFDADMEKHCTKSGKCTACGLLCTINFDQFESRKLQNERKVIIPKANTEFKEDIEVRTFWQPGKAPLAVTLLGFGMASNDRNAQAWQYDLYKAGNHVLSFDSLIRNNMNRATGHGVAGNILEEGRLTARIIHAFLATRDPETGGTYRDRVSCVRLFGASYGGNIALQTMREPSSTIWPLDRVLIISTPVDFTNTTHLFDKYFREDRSRFGKLSLARMIHGFTPDNDDPNEKELSLMRAGIGYSFHGDFVSIAKDNIERYMPQLSSKLKNMAESSEFDAHRRQQLEYLKADTESYKSILQETRQQLGEKEYNNLKSDAEARYNNQRDYIRYKIDDLSHWSFKTYFNLLCNPFWEVNGDSSDYGRLAKLMNGAPNFVQIVIAEDDPLNDPDDLDKLKAVLKEPQMLVIPHGGHLGFTGTRWFQALMGKFFAN